MHVSSAWVRHVQCGLDMCACVQRNTTTRTPMTAFKRSFPHAMTQAHPCKQHRCPSLFPSACAPSNHTLFTQQSLQKTPPPPRLATTHQACSSLFPFACAPSNHILFLNESYKKHTAPPASQPLIRHAQAFSPTHQACLHLPHMLKTYI